MFHFVLFIRTTRDQKEPMGNQRTKTNRKEPTLPKEWIKVGAAKDTDSMEVTLALRQQNLDKLRQIASDVSEPTNRKYGQHLSMKQVNEVTKPTEETYKIINNWFDNSGAAITNIESLQGGSTLRLTMSANDVKLLFKTTVNKVQLKGTKEFRFRAGASNLLCSQYLENRKSHCV